MTNPQSSLGGVDHLGCQYCGSHVRLCPLFWKRPKPIYHIITFITLDEWQHVVNWIIPGSIPRLIVDTSVLQLFEFIKKYWFQFFFVFPLKIRVFLILVQIYTYCGHFNCPHLHGTWHTRTCLVWVKSQYPYKHWPVPVSNRLPPNTGWQIPPRLPTVSFIVSVIFQHSSFKVLLWVQVEYFLMSIEFLDIVLWTFGFQHVLRKLL